ncbi:acyl-CoA dehydrogenase [Alkalimarinus sediminis]|uniref:Acyl-CoA dehydrogenase n=1 Tax=Alkalimarinus sediminis TaxID=1632866 RepID=A0A9E8HN43_9ALTE|nr:acyl-CoA dehydrogenase [Alkalimarinus sediminis]UZW76332.1 acyl-CoA dehydrogenase [Alkalimarinus sediminis]
MSHKLLNSRDVEFQLYEVLNSAALTQRPRFAEHSKETFNAAIDTAKQIATDLYAPHNAKLDANEPQFDGKKVSMIPEVKTAFDALAQAGFIAGRQDYELEGMQLPEVIMAICMGYFTAANPSSSGYSFLTSAAANLINVFASEPLKEKFLSPMLKGRFSGTMALTEPHAGSSLADIRTTAKQTDKGHYLIKGDKMYISGGDHELTENIVHLVLAKIEGAPTGVKGISLFLVPKFTLDKNGNPEKRNDVALTGLIHKLGYRGTTSTALSFGDNGDCVGYLIGEPHQGLRYMFQMMNEARVGVAMGATVIGYRGYLYSLEYAGERLQGRHATDGPETSPIAIIEHADVRRMLLAQKSYVEGGLSLCLYGASLLDDINTLSSPAEVKETHTLLDLLTPVIKSWCSEFGPKANDLAIQVLGGSGYTREYPVEQYWRDNRLNPIHEGTNGIQALDLLGRKVWQHNSLGLQLLGKRIQTDIQQAKSSGDGRITEWADELGQALLSIQKITLQLGSDLAAKKVNETLANAACYMNIIGKTVVAWLWLRQAIAAESGLTRLSSTDNTNTEDNNFYQGKLQAAQYFYKWELPSIEQDIKLLTDRDDSCYGMKKEWF